MEDPPTCLGPVGNNVKDVKRWGLFLSLNHRAAVLFWRGFACEKYSSGFCFLFFCLHLFTDNPTPLEITPRKKKKDSSASVNIASILNVNPWTMHLNSAQQLLTWRSSFYRTYCAKPCQHFMQDKPVSSWSRYSKHVSGSGFILIFSSLSKGTIDVN